MGCLLYCRTFDIGEVGGFCVVCVVCVGFVWFVGDLCGLILYMIDIYKSNYNIMNKLVYNDIRMLLINFNNNKIVKS